MIFKMEVFVFTEIEQKVKIDTEQIELDKLLKWAAVVESGGQAKHLIREGLITVNEEIETKRSRKVKKGDVVECSEMFKLVVI